VGERKLNEMQIVFGCHAGLDPASMYSVAHREAPGLVRSASWMRRGLPGHGFAARCVEIDAWIAGRARNDGANKLPRAAQAREFTANFHYARRHVGAPRWRQ
jgi:hypothetical protein